MTNEQLKQNAAAMVAFADGKPIEFQAERDDGTFSDVWRYTSNINNIDRIPHRPKPEPKTRPWSKPDDVPGPVCWLGSSSSQSLHEQHLISCVCCRGVWWHSGQTHMLSTWEDLGGNTYSTDRKTWHPCIITEE
jgi:hypothetical protein